MDSTEEGLDLEIEEGPLSDEADDEDTGNATPAGSDLPGRFLEADGANLGGRFFPLEAEDDSEEEHQDGDDQHRREEGAARRTRGMTLDLREAGGAAAAASSGSAGIIFSPGGSEAYVFPTSGLERATPAEMETRALDRRGEDLLPQRPATVGQSDTVGTAVAVAARALPPQSRVVAAGLGSPRGKDGKVRSLQERLQDFRTTLDHDVTDSASLEPSPRLPRESRRMLPRPPISRDQFLRDPDGFNISLSELDTTDASDDPSSSTSPVVPALPLSDRANSPAASVVSAASSTASGMLSGRKHLEWDSGADLGYLEKNQSEDAAASMSTLEKMAIGSYSNLLRMDPEGKSAKSKSSTRSSSATNAKSSQDAARRRAGDEARQLQLHKFADSLMRQRELRRLAAAESASRRGSGSTGGGSPRRRQRSKSRESSRQASATEDSPLSGRDRRRQHRKRQQRRRFGSPLKSNSLNDLPAATMAAGKGSPSRIRSSLSIQDLSDHWLFGGIRKFGSSEPSSCSSSATVVPFPRPRAEENPCGVLQPINTDPSSLPSQLQGIFSDQLGTLGDGSGLAAGVSSQSSLLSKRSGSRSFETVINLDHRKESQHGHHQGSKRADTSDAGRQNPSIETEDKNDSSPFGAQRGPKAAWTDEPSEFARSRPRSSQVSRNSSLATTSDDELAADDKSPNRRGNKVATASSTMESAQIDRAKSFEYFPGESFPMQENSSSYEYLPGHLVNDRPGTVVSNHRGGGGGGQESGDGGLSGVASFHDTTSSEASNGRVQRRSSAAARRRIDLGLLEKSLLSEDMHQIGDELNERSRALLKSHFSQTRRFYRKVKRCIAFASLPSQSAEDSRKKQEVLAYLMEVLESPSAAKSFLTHEDDDDDQDSRGSSKHSEPSTRQIQTETEREARGGNRSDLSSTTNGEDDDEEGNRQDKRSPKKASEPSSKIRGSKTNSRKGEIEIQKQKIQQFRAVRREMKKLEELEFAYLRQKLGGASSASSHKVGEDNTESVSFASSTSEMERPASSRRSGLKEQKIRDSMDNKAHPERQGTAPDRADPKRAPKNGPEKTVKKVTTVSGTIKTSKTHLLVVASPRRVKSKAGSDNKAVSHSASSTSTRSWSGTGAAAVDFGQTYPTPRDGLTGNKKGRKSTKGVQTTPSHASALGKKKPCAYYLPLGGQSVIRLGTRTIPKESEDGTVSKENRSILANYIAGIEADTRPIKPKRGNTADGKAFERDAPPDVRRYTLSDALSLRRPDFVAEAERRRRHLAEMRQRRIDNEDARRKWAEDVARMPVSQRRRGERAASPPPLFRVTRLFGHREMVEATRRRYQELPEVHWKRTEAKKMNSLAANRVIKGVYGRRLQEKVLRGKVSLTHHRTVMDGW